MGARRWISLGDPRMSGLLLQCISIGYLMGRVKSEKKVDKIRRNILVHGRVGETDSKLSGIGGDVGSSTARGTTGMRRKKKKENFVPGLEKENSREIALQEREAAEKEVEKLRQIVRRQRKELKNRMIEVSREEAERKRMLDERAIFRLKSCWARLITLTS